MSDSAPPEPRLYHELADWFHLLTAPEDYTEEAALYRKLLVDACQGPLRTLLELGSGGGNNASHLKHHFTLTQGDMRTLRLGREFGAVFVHDAIYYMTTEDDLEAALRTAFVHCRPGGGALFCPDSVRENFRETTDSGGHNGNGRSLRYLEWSWDPDPTDSTYTADYAYLLHQADGSVRVEQDRHIDGLFSRETWLRLLERTGFRARAVPFEHSELEPGSAEVLVAVKPR